MTAATAAPTHRGQRRAVGPLTGLRSLLRLHLRLARRGILIWTLAVLVLVPASIYAMEDVYPDQAALDARATLLDNPSAVMMTGPFFAADHYTFWAMVANELLAADRDGAIERLGETLQIAVLHDTLEDTATSPEELRQQFGEFVCAGVQALSKRVGDGPKRSLDDYLQALAEGPAQYALVKLCDRITNLQPPPQTWNQDKIANYHQESQLILARLGHAHAATARRLREKIEHYRQYY